MTKSAKELFQSNADNIVAASKFYPAKISVHHHQLRHLVSVASGNRVYYVNDFDVFVLDVDTNRSTLLATIPFEARCLAADYGWVCVGGEQNGDCAFIRLSSEHDLPKCFDHDLNVDVLGGEIVNSMNIHMLREHPDSEPEPIVLISNNDRSIKIFSLARREVLTTLEHDTPMNYAAISPDSTLLAAVGDSDTVYFYQRRKIEPTESKEPASKFPNFDWRPYAVPSIPTGDSVHDDHGFAVTFSPAGHLCAASSQGGAITVFDVNLLLDREYEAEDSILCTFRSSRPTLWGCVRSMVFSPQPWDLLAWAEDHGRVGVADIRQMFVRRQIVQLDKDHVETAEVVDNTPLVYRNLSIKERLKQQHLARLRSMRGSTGDDVGTDRLLEETRADIMQRRQRRQDLMSYHRGLDLDARERSVIDALETTMDDVEHHPQPYSVNYTTPPRFRPSYLADPDSERDLDARLMPSSIRVTDPVVNHRSYRPQRRTSVVLSDSTVNRHLAPMSSPRARISASPGRITDDEDMPSMATNDLTPARGGSTSQPRTSDIPTSDPWHVIQSALETARRTEEANVSGDRPTLAQIEQALEAERRLGSQLERQLADERQLSNLLRLQLETQDRILQSQQRELEVAAQVDAQLQPSIERLLQRELASEQQFGEQRSRDLEEEIRSGTTRARRLENVRARILGSMSQSLDSSSTSAQTSALPTISTNIQQVNESELLSPPSPDSLGFTLQRHEAYHRQRAQHIENLERQVRRAESRVASASSDIQTLENAIQRGTNSERLVRQHEARVRAASVSASASLQPSLQHHGTATQPTSQRSMATNLRDAARTMRAITERTQRPTTANSNRTVSELAGRTSDNELQLARMMFLSGGNRATDANGNWVAGGGLHRMLAQASAGASGSRAGPSASVADVVREMGVGTAGIGWSADGRSL
jgi:hypothetical protein